MSKSIKKSNIIGIVVLLIGILAGVYLVQQSQEFREKAGLEVEQMVVICHQIPNKEGFWEDIEVPESSLEMYIDQGDLLGSCPESFNIVKKNVVDVGDDKGSETQNDTVNENEGDKLSINLGGDLSENPEPEEEVGLVITPTPAEETVESNSTFRFFIKLQGVNASRPTRSVNITFTSDTETHTYKAVRISPNSEGVYFGQLDDITSGTFNISFKTDSHLRETFENINIKQGLNTWYFENNPLIAGDFDSDNIIDVYDIALFMAELDSTSINVDQKNKHFDVDANAKIDIEDLKLVLNNFDGLVVMGE